MSANNPKTINNRGALMRDALRMLAERNRKLGSPINFDLDLDIEEPDCPDCLTREEFEEVYGDGGDHERNE